MTNCSIKINRKTDDLFPYIFINNTYLKDSYKLSLICIQNKKK